jgi:protocatechuate 3,4-dioxygenase, beta subunit
MNPTIHPFHIPLSRRKLLHSLLLTTGGVITGSLYAEALALTPRATEGPYYPDHLPLDQDNDLTLIIGGKAPSNGVVTEFGGRLLNVNGKPIQDAVIEVWQSDNNGCYIHSREQGTRRHLGHCDWQDAGRAGARWAWSRSPQRTATASS